MTPLKPLYIIINPYFIVFIPIANNINLTNSDIHNSTIVSILCG